MSTTPESEKIELIISIGKRLVDGMPAGGWVNEFIDFRSRIRQNRLNSFIESLQKYLDQSSNKSKFHFDLLTEEEFTDIFEGVLRRVAQTKSISKLDRFKNILLNQVNANADIDMVETFLDLTLRLHDKQIQILIEHNQLADQLHEKNILEVNNTIKIQLQEEKELRNQGKANNFDSIKGKLDQFEEKRNGAYYKLSQDEYLFFIQDLVSKSLLLDSGIGGIGVQAYEIVEITAFGKKYLEFINTEGCERSS